MNNDTIEKVLKIFLKNNIKLEFSAISQLSETLTELQSVFVSRRIKEIFEESKQHDLVELNVRNKEILSIGKFYSYYTAHLCNLPQIKKQLQIICDLFSFVPGSPIGIFSIFGIMYSGKNQNVVEGFYYAVDNKILLTIEKESVIEFLKVLNMGDTHLRFIENMPENIVLDYLGFDNKETLIKYGLFATKEMFFGSNPRKHFGEYTKINEVLTVIETYFNGEEEGISLQYTPLDQNYFAIEVSVLPEKLLEFAKVLFDNNVIDEIEYDNYANLNVSEDYLNCAIKFRWNDFNTFEIKLYLEQETN